VDKEGAGGARPRRQPLYFSIRLRSVAMPFASGSSPLARFGSLRHTQASHRGLSCNDQALYQCSRMKIVIQTPELWVSESDLICSSLIGCLRKRGLEMKTTDFEFVPKKGFTMMNIDSANCSILERALINDCIFRLSYVASQSDITEKRKGGNLLENLGQFSSKDKKEIQEFEDAFKKWFAEVDAKNDHPSSQ
jgi:hypothetical protein